MSLAGQVFSNRYEIEREVARGGMAEVYLARDQLLNRPVALKCLFPEYAREPSFVERFRREAQAAANLNHPNIVAIYDWGQESGTYFIVMEYVEGRSLRDLLRAEAPLDPNQTAEIGAEIASALAFAHRSGVVHRDVKPGNVLLTRAGNVKVTDFGIARAGASDALTQTGSVMGTATYFSPEQAQGEPVDGRSDVYSLGVVLYEMVTGVAPFSGDSPVSVAYKHVREEPTAPAQRNPDVPTDLEHIILTAMAKDPDLRYQTADDLRADLLRFRRGRPLASAPVTALITEVPTSATTAAATGAYAATIATPKVDDRGRSAEGAAYERKRRNPAVVTTLALLALAAIVGLILFAATKLGDSQGHVTVPNVVGEKVGQATKDLEAEHLVAVIKPVADSRPKNLVLRQNPTSGTRIEKGSNVTLFVSTGAAQKKIPLDIVNKSAADAENELTGLGFVVAKENKASDTVPKDFVVDSKPEPGKFVSVGSTVTLIVSTGPEQITVPDVSGDTLDQARSELTLTGFFNFAPLQEASSKIPKGQVTRTDPAKGSTVAKNTVIKIYVSTGPTTVTVPQEIGKPEATATADLESQGFVVQTIEQLSTPGNAGKVIDQNPQAGTAVAPKSTVVLTIGATVPVSTTSTTGP
jgi:beta-lactam-binding protein with PASTA domain/tRNA A-37 threonylcarbamoyl transferase component Bud32